MIKTSSIWCMVVLVALQIGLSVKPLVAKSDILIVAQAKTGAKAVAKGKIFGKWQLICPKKENSGLAAIEHCRIAQTILAENGTSRIFLIRVYRGKTPVALVSTPIGIFLKPGMALAVDRNKGRVFSFETCDTAGCHTGIALSDSVIDEFKSGTTALFSFYDGARNRISIPVSLVGFKAAFEKMMK